MCSMIQLKPLYAICMDLLGECILRVLVTRIHILFLFFFTVSFDCI